MRKIRVMLVDDERALRSLLKIAVHWEKWNIEIVGEAGSGSEAINNIDELMPDLLIVDIKMPYMDGIEFSRILAGRYPKMRIIILTAYADFSYAKECIEIESVLGYALKPVNPVEIESYLEKFCRNMEFEEPDKPEEGSIRKNPDVIQKIDEYIENNYMNSYLNVGAVAEQFSYSANYLGTMYKKNTGKLLSDKIFIVRMEHAKELKRQGMKMYLVSKEVGIDDPVYFSKCFRKYTGCNFSDYQEEV